MKRKGLTLVDVLALTAIVALLTTILLPSLMWSRELARRNACATNLKGIGTGFATSASESSPAYPIPPALDTRPPPGQTLVCYIGVGKARYAATTTASTSVCTSRSFWHLVRDGVYAPKHFICPSSDQTPAADPSPGTFYDFPGGNNLSYGVQVPFGSKGSPSCDRETRMPLAADRGWFGAAQETGLMSPGDPVNVTAATGPRGWRPWNSPNHGGPGNGEGQNVLFADFHVEFDDRPIAGIAFDNIYTAWAAQNATEDQRVRGEMEKPSGGRRPGYVAPFADTDTVIYP